MSSLCSSALTYGFMSRNYLIPLFQNPWPVCEVQLQTCRVLNVSFATSMWCKTDAVTQLLGISYVFSCFHVRNHLLISTLSLYPLGLLWAPVGSQLLILLVVSLLLLKPRGPHKQGAQRQPGLRCRRGAEALGSPPHADTVWLWDVFGLTFSSVKWV